MQPKVELSQIRNLGEIIDDSILFFKQTWKPLLKSYFTISGFFLFAGVIISVFNQTKIFQLQQQGESIFSATYFLTIFFYLVNFIFISLTGLSFITLYHEKGKEAPSVEEVWGYVKYYFLRVFGSSLLLTALWVVGIFLCILPGIYFMPVFLLIITIIVFENATLGYAFNRAFQLIRDRWWQMFGTLMVMGLIVGCAIVLLSIPLIIITALILFLTNVNHEHTESIALVLTFSLFQVLWLLPTISIALTYFSLNEQKDDNNLFQRIEMLGKNNYDIDHLPSEEY
jgi:hypothetical protein